MREHVKQALDQSMTRFLAALSRFLPGLVALIVAMYIVSGEIAKHVFYRQFELTRAGRP